MNYNLEVFSFGKRGVGGGGEREGGFWLYALSKTRKIYFDSELFIDESPKMGKRLYLDSFHRQFKKKRLRIVITFFCVVFSLLGCESSTFFLFLLASSFFCVVLPSFGFFFWFFFCCCCIFVFFVLFISNCKNVYVKNMFRKYLHVSIKVKKS